MAQRAAVRAIQAKFQLSQRRACALVGLRRSTCRYRPRRQDWPALRDRLRALAGERRRFGYRRLYVLLRREGFLVNRKRIYRLYTQEGLTIRRRKRRRRVPRGVPRLPAPTRINERAARGPAAPSSRALSLRPPARQRRKRTPRRPGRVRYGQGPSTSGYSPLLAW